MRRIRPGPAYRAAFLAITLSWWTGSAVVAQGADDPTPSAIERDVDPSIRPGDDFFAYANGGWLKSTTIPVGMERWTARNEIDELTRQQILKLLDSAGTAPAGSAARKVADFRAAWLNEVANEARGMTALKPVLDSIDHVQDKAALTRVLGRELGADVDPMNWGVYRSSHLLGLSVEPSIHGEKTYVAFLLQGGLGLPDREHYVSAEPSMAELRGRYQEYIGRLMSLGGFDRAEQRARAVMALETAMARAQATREASANEHNADSLWTRADFARRAPGMDWSACFAAAGLARQKAFVGWQPGALEGLAALVASESLETWKDYLRFHVFDAAADVLPRAFAEQALALHSAATTGQPEPTSRAQRALEATQAAMSDALGRMYAERYFPAEKKARVRAIATNVIEAFRRGPSSVNTRRGMHLSWCCCPSSRRSSRYGRPSFSTRRAGLPR